MLCFQQKQKLKTIIFKEKQNSLSRRILIFYFILKMLPETDNKNETENKTLGNMLFL